MSPSICSTRFGVANFSDCLVGLVPLAWLIVANTLEVEVPLENVES